MTLKKLAIALMATTIMAGGVNAATLDIAIDSSPAGLDPHLITAFNSVVIVQGNIYEALTMVAQDLSIQPALAQSWDVSDDGLTYTFKLQSGVLFHDGTTMDAQDVAASIRRVQNAEMASPYASRVAPITAIEIIDPLTVQFKLDKPFAPILTSLAGIAIVPAEIEMDKEGLQQVPVGTGPFKFDEWQPNGFISLVKFDDYRQAGLPKLDGLRFNFVPEAATRLVGVTSGQYDLLPGIDPATALQLQSQPGVTVQETRDIAYSLLGMNVEREPFNDPRVRRAINMLLNRDEIVAGALFGAGVPGGPLSPALATWALDTSSFDCYNNDVEAAKALLAEAGLQMPVKISINVLPRQDIKDIAQVAQQQLEAGGFEVELLNQEIGAFVQDWKNSNFDMFASVNGGQPDPDGYFYRTFYSTGSTNVFNYNNPEMDALLDQGRSETDTAARKVIYDQIQQDLACEGPISFIAYGDLYTAVNDSVQGYEIYPNGRLTSLIKATLSE